MKDCVIICGGDECPIPKADFYIACDKGFGYAQKQNVKCDIVLGDFDSYDKNIYGEEIPKDAIILPKEKDDTDLMFAIKTALKKDFDKITVTCALGGRADHFLSNIQSIVFVLEEKTERGEKIEIKIDDEKNEITAIKNSSIKLQKREGWCFSVLAHSSVSTGVSIVGAKYSAENIMLTNSFPLGQSNEWKDEEVEVRVKDGIILVFLSKC